MPRTRDQELTLATALASTTDKGRAEMLANMEGDEAPKTKAKDTKSEENPVEEEMEKQEQASAVDAAWSKAHDAVRAAQESCRKEAEASKDADPEDMFRKHVGYLVDVLEEMRDSEDVFKKMAKDAKDLKPY